MAKPSRRKPFQKLVEETAKASPILPYEIDMTASAEAVYVDLYKKCKRAEDAGDFASAHCTVFRMIQQAIKEAIPLDPLNRKFALTGELSNIYRIKKGRYRICWIASSQLRRVCILFIAETLRKEGDINDPYRVFAQMVMSGRFNDAFGELGVRMAHLQSEPPKKPNK